LKEFKHEALPIRRLSAPTEPQVQGFPAVWGYVLGRHQRFTMPGLDPGIFFRWHKEDGRVRPGHGERVEGIHTEGKPIT
jgi:hypothetical protein